MTVTITRTENFVLNWWKYFKNYKVLEIFEALYKADEFILLLQLSEGSNLKDNLSWKLRALLERHKIEKEWKMSMHISIIYASAVTPILLYTVIIFEGFYYTFRIFRYKLTTFTSPSIMKAWPKSAKGVFKLWQHRTLRIMTNRSYVDFCFFQLNTGMWIMIEVGFTCWKFLEYSFILSHEAFYELFDIMNLYVQGHGSFYFCIG